MNIIADTHCHSLASGHAYSTIEEIMRAAAERKMFAVAVTDHGRLIPGSPANWYFENLRVLPRKINGVMLLKGAEANVSDYDGNIDLSEKDLRSLEWVVASMHKDVLSDPCSVDDCSRAWLNIAKNPRVNVIGHSGADKFKYDYEMLIPMFAQEGKLVEINNASFYVRRDSIENCKKIAKICMKHSVPVVVNSDAHSSFQVGRVDNVITFLKELDFPEELIVNANVDRFKKYLREYTPIGDEI